ncbi:MAG: peptidoglycan DD-metalloendopeptidase family protein [Gracilibacteraceae bacterium]|nr:peptidoglycan DD-metalloendopeptidase family protein [Gracilibacteraceae bacterium]
MKKRYSIIIVPPENEKKPHQIEFTITVKKILIAGAALFLLAVSLLAVANVIQAAYINGVQQKIAYNEALEKEIEAKKLEIERLTEMTAAINADLQAIAEYESEINSVLDIAPSSGGAAERSRGSSDRREVPVAGNLDEAAVHVAAYTQSMKEIYSASLVFNEKLRHLPTIYPVKNGVLSSNYGYRANPFGGSSSEFHDGVDFSCPYGSPVYAAAAGTVTSSSYESGWGYRLIIDHGNGVVTFYAHNSSNLAQAGDVVDKGELIAYSGNSGRSTGSHLHFGASINGASVNPLSFFNK